MAKALLIATMVVMATLPGRGYAIVTMQGGEGNAMKVSEPGE